MKTSRVLLALATALLLPACGGGGSGGAPPPAPQPDPTATVQTPAGTQVGSVAVSYSLVDLESDPCTILAEYSLDGGTTWLGATAGAAGDGTEGLAAQPDPGTAHTFAWNSLMDGVGLGSPESVKFRITPSNTVTGPAAESGAFSVDNSANTAPSVAVTTPVTSSGLIPVSYTLTDAESDDASITVEYSVDSGANWATAFDGPGGDGRSALGSAPGGAARTYVWNSFENGVATGGALGTVRIRITPTDGQAGPAVSSADFTLDNSTLSAGGLVSPYPVIYGANGGSARSVTTDGRYLWIVGDQSVTATNYEWRIEKRNAATGALVSIFGTGGAVTSDPSSGLDNAWQVLKVGPYLYVAGYEERLPLGVNNNQIRIEKRLALDGSIVASFGSGGAITTLPQDSHEIGGAIATDGTYLYVAGAEFNALDEPYIRVEKRRLSDGSLVAAFGNAGVVEGVIGAALTVLVSNGSLYVGGATVVGGDFQGLVEKRSLATGALDASFGTAGRVTFDLDPTALEVVVHLEPDGDDLLVSRAVESPAGSDNFVPSIVKVDGASGAAGASMNATFAMTDSPFLKAIVDGGAAYLSGPRVEAAPGDNQWKCEKRALSDLALDAGWATAGVFTSNPSASSDSSEDLVATGGVIFLVGSDEVSGGRWRILALYR